MQSYLYYCFQANVLKVCASWCMCSLWQDLLVSFIYLEHVNLTMTFDLLLKHFNIANNFFIVRDRLTVRDRTFISHNCVLYDIPYWWCYEFLTCDLDCDLWPILLKNYNTPLDFLTIRDGAFILCMCIPYDKTLYMYGIINFEHVNFDILLKNINFAHYFLTERLSYLT